METIDWVFVAVLALVLILRLLERLPDPPLRGRNPNAQTPKPPYLPPSQYPKMAPESEDAVKRALEKYRNDNHA